MNFQEFQEQGEESHTKAPRWHAPGSVRISVRELQRREQAARMFGRVVTLKP